MPGNQYGCFFCALSPSLHEIVANERIESREGFVQNEQSGMIGKRGGERRLHSHAARKMLELPTSRKIELTNELGRASVVPGWIEAFAVGQKVIDSHPVGHF